ncbi:MAG: class I SAM-dependent methyltransferase [Planctomycetota bacterium]
MRLFVILAILLCPAVVDAGIFGFRSSGSRGVTSYTAVNGKITNTNCQCGMCQAARAAAAAGRTTVCWGGKCYPISQLTNHARSDTRSVVPTPVVRYQSPVVQYTPPPAPVVKYAPPPPPASVVVKTPVVPAKRLEPQPADPVTQFTPTPEDAAALMVALARVTETDVVYDLGCGDGRILEQAASSGAVCVGFELNPATVRKARLRTKRFRNVEIIQGDMFDEDVRGADVVFLYHYPPMLRSLLPKLKRLRPGARVISFSHDIPGCCTQEHRIGGHVFYSWIVGDTVSSESFSIASRLSR